MPGDPRHKSRALTEGPDRAPARAMLKAIGFSSEDLAKPADRRGEHLDRDHALQLPPAPPGGAGEGGHPRRRRHADGVQHHRHQRRRHHGHRGHEGLAGQPRGDRRLHRAGRPRPPVRRRWWPWSAATRPSPARPWRSLRLDLPSLVLYGGSIAPAGSRAATSPSRTSSRASGAHAAGRMSAAQLQRSSRTSACPGAGACGGQYTANTMALAMEVLGLSPVGYATIPAEDPRKDEATRAAGALVVELLQAGARPRQHPDPRLVRERHRRGRRDRWLDQRRAAPARAGARGRHPAGHRRLRPGQPAHPAPGRPQARRDGTSPWTWTGPAACRCSSQRLLEAGRLDGEAADRRRPDAGREHAAGRGRRRASRWCGRSSEPVEPDRRPGHPAREPRARGLRAEDVRPRAVAPPRAGAGVRARGGRLRRGARRAASAGRRGGHPLRGPAGRPGHARDARASPRRSSARAWASTVALITDGRFSGATRGLMVGPRGAGGGGRRPDRRDPRGRPGGDRRRTPRALRRGAARRGDRGTARAPGSRRGPRYASGVFAKYAALVTSAAEGAITLPPRPSTPKEQ